jgi:hypothetical protein
VNGIAVRIPDLGRSQGKAYEGRVIGPNIGR